MAKSSVDRFDYTSLKKRDPSLYRHLLYEIARLFVNERRNFNQIPESIYWWAQVNASAYYNAGGGDNIDRKWVRARIVEAARNRFIVLGKFTENVLITRINTALVDAQHVSLQIAPDEKLLLRQVCLDCDQILMEKMRSTAPNEEVVIGVSGGNTMLALAHSFHDMRELMDWHRLTSSADKARVVVCSLTSGGTRDDISALSDTVAANIAQELGVRARGLLGPPSFAGNTAHDAFKKEPDVESHIRLVQNAHIILTSVGNVHDDSSLTSKVFNVIDENHLRQIRSDHPHLGDMLYQCYNGSTGDVIPPSTRIAERIFWVITLLELRDRVMRGQTRCIVVAKGYEKGNHALRGLIIKRMASDIYMDLRCAQGLSDAC